MSKNERKTACNKMGGSEEYFFLLCGIIFLIVLFVAMVEF